MRIRGFTLIESVVAIGIIGLLIMSVGAMLQRLPVSTREVRDQDLALRIARNQVEYLRSLGYALLPSSGPFNDTMLASLSQGTGVVTLDDFNPETKQAVVTVSWTGTGSTTRSVSLTTLITENSLFK